MKEQNSLPSASVLSILAFLGAVAFASGLHAADWSYRTAHNYVLPAEDGVELTDHGYLVRPAWSYEIHTGINSSSSGPAGHILAQGFEPTYGETSAAVVVDGVYILSWSEATGDVIARPGSITDRYWRGEGNYQKFKDTYFRIDANWNTIALDAATGEKLWQVSQPSATINFQSSKRDHNGIDPAAGNGIYVTLTVTGRVYAYDIATGEKRWETNVGEWHEEAEAFKAEALEERNLPIVNDGMFGNLRAGAVILGDKVIIPDLHGGLIALQSEDGSELWRLEDRVMNRQGNPRLWEHEGDTYLLTHQNRRGDNAVYLIDPSDGSILWSHETGHNPGKLILGEDTVLLNPEREDPGLLAAYRISLDGLERMWRFDDVEEGRVKPNHVHLSGSRGAERKGVIDDGRLYIAIGQPNKRPQGRRLAVFDLATGEELYRSDYTIPASVAAPVSYGDKLYWQITSTSAENAGLYIYQKHEDGRIERLGEARYRALGAQLTTDYLHPTDRPFSEGRTFLRGRTNLVALDLREPERSVNVQLENAWAGFVRPLSGVLVANEDRQVEVATIEVPPRRELGVPGTTARRNDIWSRMELTEPLKIGDPCETTATMHMSIFSWPAHIVMEEAKGNEWHGQWTRTFPGWEETHSYEGTLHETSEGGYDRRGWPTGWLEDQPVTFYSDLEQGQERVFLQVHGALPRKDGSRQNVTICLDHDGEKVVSAVAAGFSYNQSYHEVDASGLEVTTDGITGTAHVILNGDPWLRDPDWKNGGSLLGLLTLDTEFGEPDDNGVYSVSGDWTLEWGLSEELSGDIRATLEQ